MLLDFRASRLSQSPEDSRRMPAFDIVCGKAPAENLCNHQVKGLQGWEEGRGGIPQISFRIIRDP